MKPKITFVCATRNDGYTSNFTLRLQRSMQALLEQLDEYAVTAEIIYVEWNPPAGKPSLAEVLTPHASSTMCSVRVITVPAKYHRGFRGWDEIGLHLSKASNVGYRRARGGFCVWFPSDMFYSDMVVQKMGIIHAEEGKMYRVDRYDVFPSVLEEPYTDRQTFLQACANSIETHHQKYPDEDVIKHFRIPPLHTNACADFNPIPTKTMWEIRGYREADAAFLDLDSLVLHGAACLGLKEEIWSKPCAVYKIFHAKMTMKNRITQQASHPNQQIKWLIVRAGVRAGLDENHVRAWLDVPRRGRLPMKGTFPSFERNFLARVWKWHKRGYTPLNDAHWGLGQETLPEIYLCKAKWDT